MTHPWLLVAGATIAGFLLPEILAALGNKRIPLGMNLTSALACGLIAAAFA